MIYTIHLIIYLKPYLILCIRFCSESTMTPSTKPPKASLPETRYSPFYMNVYVLELLDKLAAVEKRRRTSVIEEAIRERAERKGIK